MSNILVFNNSILDELRSEIGVEDTVELLRAFLSDTALKIDLIASREADRAALRRESHSIKSSSATLGFEKLSALARDLEANAASLDAAQATASVVLLGQAFREVSELANRQLLGENNGVRS